jgi:hypothetical protein
MPATTRHKPRSRGQIVVIFAISVMAFVGLCAIVIDVSWYWANSLRMQRAADAAALAGVIRLPADFAGATTLARAESKKNGYENGVNGVSVTPVQDPTNNRRLRVTITADIGTFFARVIGVNSFHTSRSSKAEYVLPVPMGSPENYYGIYGMVRHCSTAVAGTVCNQTGGTTEYTDNTVITNPTTSYMLPTTSPSGSWTNPTRAYSSSDSGSSATTTATATPTSWEAWGGFGITLTGTGTNTIQGIQVEVRAANADASGCTLGVELSWNAANVGTASGWTTTGTAIAITSASLTTYTVGGAANLWGRTWTPTEVNNANLRVRLANIDPGAACTNSSQASVDYLRVRVTYQNSTTTTTSVFTPDSGTVAGPQGQALTARGFWGMMLSQGAETIAGDAYLPKYDTAGGATNPNYDSTNYYNYAIEMAAGSTGGSVWIYDPGFCAGNLSTGLGDTWIGSKVPISSFYDLYDTMGTPYDLTDDTLVTGFSSGNTFKNQDGSDPALSGSGGSGIAGCDAYHLGWYQLGTSTLAGGAAGHTYRLHTSTTDPSSPTAQLSANARNGWALFTKVTGGTAPRVYGIGAMEMYTPLPSGTSSEFYLAQIEAAHAGKTMEVRLFDAGDTNQDANIQILIPTSGGWSTTNFNYTAAKGTTNSGATNCNSSAGTNVSNVITYQSGASRFNGCWITIQIPIPTTYTAPQSGWWKIKYNMTGSGANATDITTWQVQIRGNPVHLILP